MLRKLFNKATQVVYSAAVWTVAFAWMGGVATTWAVSSLFVSTRKTHNYIGGPGMGACLKITLSKVERHPPPRLRPPAAQHVRAKPRQRDGRPRRLRRPLPRLLRPDERLAVQDPVLRLDHAPRRRHPGALRQRQPATRDVAAAARERIAQGLSILVYPEAHRTRDGKVHEFKKGAFLMAREAGLPIVPLATRGMFEMNRKGTWLFTPTKITIYVGAQIETVGLSNDELLARSSPAPSRSSATSPSTASSPASPNTLEPGLYSRQSNQ
jgi:hypothetical protein